MFFYIIETRERFERCVFEFAEKIYPENEIGRSYRTHLLRGVRRTCVTLYPPVTVALFHRGNSEANMAEKNSQL